MKTLKKHIEEGKVTVGMIKSLGFLLRNKLSNKNHVSFDEIQTLDVCLFFTN